MAVAEPRGCMLAAPTGWVSKALRQVGRDQGAPDGSRRVSWGEAERYLSKTATRAMKLTANRFREAKVLAGGGKAQFFTQPEVVTGRARFLSPTSALVVNEDAAGQSRYRPAEVHFETAFIAVGSSSLRLGSLPWEAGEAAKWLYDGDTVRNIERVPDRLVIQGGGTISIEYAFIFRSLGAKVTVLLREDRVMQRVGLDPSVQDAVRVRMEKVGIVVVTGAGAIEVSPPEMRYGEGRIVVTSGPNAGKVLQCDAFLSATGREGLCAALDPAAAGLQEPKWGCMEVEGPTMRCLPAEGRDEREPPPQIFAAGDAAYGSDVSPPGLLSTGKAEAYVATHAAFPHLMESEIGMMGVYEHFCPCAVWIEPDIAYVGYPSDAAEEQFGGKDEVGSSKVFFTETVKGCIEKEKGRAARDHFFKVVYKVNEPGSGRILGVHVYGYEASEMIHNAGTLVNSGKTVSTCGRCAGRGRGLTEKKVFDIVRTVPPAVTMQECLKIACTRAALDITARTCDPDESGERCIPRENRARSFLLERNLAPLTE